MLLPIVFNRVLILGIGICFFAYEVSAQGNRHVCEPRIVDKKPLNASIKEPRRPQRAPGHTVTHENLIDQIDVYALSPHSKKLVLPRMIPQVVVEKVMKGKMTLPQEWDAIVQRASIRHNLDPALIAAVICVESGFLKKAVSCKGAQGLMQVMPQTASELGVIDIFDPSENIDAGSRYLRQQLDRFGSLELALAAYNAGPGAVTKYGGIPPYKETQNFIKRVLSKM